MTEPRTTRPRNRLLRSPTTSSMANVMAARGVLKAAARPAEAPTMVGPRRSLRGVPRSPDMFEATPAPM